MIWQLFVTIRESDSYGNAVHSQSLSFHTKDAANKAYDALEYQMKYNRSNIYEVVKLY